MADSYIKALINYAVANGLIEESDRVYCTNAVMAMLKLDSYDASCEAAEGEINEILDKLCDIAAEKEIIIDSITYRDLFDTAIMGALTPRPSQVIAKFNELYAQSPEAATDYYYRLSGDTNYIRRDRIARILKWQQTGEYGTIDITVNLSKPEKTPRLSPTQRMLRSRAIRNVCSAENARATQAELISLQDRITELSR